LLYSNGIMAGGSEDARQQYLVYWNYMKDQPSAVSPVIPLPVLQEPSPADDIRDFLSRPAGMALSLLVLAAVVALIIIVYRKKYREATPFPGALPVAENVIKTLSPPPAQHAATVARLLLPNGIEIPVTGNKIIGRSDLVRVLELDELGLISRRQFEIKCEGDKFYIEDPGSANGTRVNGIEIRGRGPVPVSDEDTIEPAGAVCLRMRIIGQSEATAS
jgi:hypothetical protein